MHVAEELSWTAIILDLPPLPPGHELTGDQPDTYSRLQLKQIDADLKFYLPP